MVAIVHQGQASTPGNFNDIVYNEEFILKKIYSPMQVNTAYTYKNYLHDVNIPCGQCVQYLHASIKHLMF